MNDFEPKQFGKYWLMQKIAVGGMAEIYKAKTYGVDGFEKQLVIKRILPHCSTDKDFITMLIDEAKLSVLLSHANIVQVYDLGKVSDDYYISMEFIHGVNLRDTIYRCRELNEAIPSDIAVYIISEICKGLDYAHRKTDHNNQPLNIVHRDISPQNILISHEGEVKIGDFGIAKAAMNISHTMAGILKGKIAYMSPEQAMGKKVERRTDIFSAGILLYETLSGSKLFTGESQFEVLKKIRTLRVSIDKLPDSIPQALKPIVAKALAFNADDRYQHAGDLQIELTKFLYSTYSDFSPRKLATFIAKIFEKEIREEQTSLAHERELDEMTSSVDIDEGARQMDIVHRKDSESSLSDKTATGMEAVEGELSTTATPTGTPIKIEPSISRIKKPPKRKKRKKKGFFRKIAPFIALAVAAGAAFNYIPELRFWEKSVPVEPAAEEVVRFGSVNVTSKPEGANVFLDGKDTGRTTPTVLEELTIGKNYTVKVEKENFGPTEKTVPVTSPERIDIDMALAEPEGSLNIITDPSGAAIILDGRLSGLTTPAELEKLPLGKDLRITLSKPGYEDFEQLISLTSSKPQRISTKLKMLAPQVGKLAISSSPKGASIFVDGKDTRKSTSATLANLKPGKYTVVLKMDGYQQWTESFEVAIDKTTKGEAKLAKIDKPQAIETPVTEPPVTEEKPGGKTPKEKTAAGNGKLRLTSTPSGALVFLDGKSTGKMTPTTIEDLNIGATYKLRFDMDGYKSSYRKKLMRRKSEKLAVNLTRKKEVAAVPAPAPAQTPATPVPAPSVDYGPSARSGTIRVTSKPSGAEVYFNAILKGKTPLTAEAPAGTVHILVNKEGWMKHTKSVTVKPGQKINVTNVTLGKMYGQVTFKSTPSGAQLIFDGKTFPAKTPVTVKKVLMDRQHTATIKLSGYRPWSHTFSMGGQTNRDFNVTLQP